MENECEYLIKKYKLNNNNNIQTLRHFKLFIYIHHLSLFFLFPLHIMLKHFFLMFLFLSKYQITWECPCIII